MAQQGPWGEAGLAAVPAECLPCAGSEQAEPQPSGQHFCAPRQSLSSRQGKEQGAMSLSGAAAGQAPGFSAAPRGREVRLYCSIIEQCPMPLPDPSASPWLQPFLCPIPSTYPSGDCWQGAALQQWGLPREWDREKGASCPGTEVVSAAGLRCRTFCRGDAAEPALPVAALEPSGAAGVIGTEWGLQAQAAHEVPWTPPWFLGVPCVGMAM